MAKSAPNDIFQYSLLSAYHAGLKDGGPPVAFLANHGTHGIGIFEDEDNDAASDFLQIDAVPHAIDPSGSVSRAAPDDQLPFAMVTAFQPASRANPPPGTTAQTLRDVFARTARNTPLPFRLRGAFRYINTRQATYWDVRGTIFGFAVPGWLRGVVGGEGLQCGFVAEDGGKGGRVVDFETGREVLVEWAKCGRLHLGFPRDEEFEELKL